MRKPKKHKRCKPKGRKRKARRCRAIGRASAMESGLGKRRRQPRRDTPGRTPPPLPPAPGEADPLAYTGPFGVREAQRLLWRAGFGPTPGDAEALAALGLRGAVLSLTRPAGTAALVGPAPYTEFDPELSPGDVFQHDHLGWLDRMVRSTHPLIERIALIWHDWFGVSDEFVHHFALVDAHIDLFRRQGLGSFRDLLIAVASDPAMLVRLDGKDNHAGATNENFARELMELFTLGADRGAYTEPDIREAARALTGWTADYVGGIGWTDFAYDPARHDTGVKRIFGQDGQFDWRATCELCLSHPLHPSFFVLKLWSYFIPTPPDAATQAELERRYLASGMSILVVLEAILMHPAFYTGSPLVKPPVVYAAGLMRAVGRGIESIGWAGYAEGTGQYLYFPPTIAGWKDDAWLDTSTLMSRWRLIDLAVKGREHVSGAAYPAGETPEQAVDAAVAFWGGPAIGADARAVLLDVASRIGALPGLSASDRNGHRQSALRRLVAFSSDFQVC